MAFIAPLLGAVGAGLGLFSQIKASKKAAAPPPPVAPTPKTPTPEDATGKAAAKVKRRRRISLLSGGKTNVTGGQAVVGEAQLGRKELTGA